MKSAALLFKFKSQAKVKPIKKLDDILIGCLSDDEQCREWVYKSFYGYLMGVVIRYNNDVSQAEELVNDSFIKIFKNIRMFIHPEDPENLLKAFKGWIARIASRTAIDFLRIAKNNQATDELTEMHTLTDHVTVVDKMNAQDILKLLNNLPQIQRVIFNMYEIEGFKHEEIATELNIPVKNSRVYLARAKERLRALYQQTLNRSGA
ncbi:RNA polymerase sigma factor [Mucilaginibacter gynuensis]|uniref:RNA polymerase sigma factor n=1 Tax=Mucilaginibacter gynuensis TaxID=1302236 RepID=A0ABP8HA17_9SPHI